MSETTTDPEDDRDDESGASEDGSGDQDTTAGAPATPSEEELRRRRMQSDLDRERAANERLRKQLAAQAPAGESDTSDIRAQIRAEVAREHEMAATAAALRTEFPFAAELLRDTTRFDGPEDMRYQASSRHAAVKVERDALAEDVARRVREEYGEKLSSGPKDGGSDPPAPSDRLTAAAVGRMGVEDLLQTKEEDLKRLARSMPQE